MRHLRANILSTVDALAANASGNIRYTAWTFGTETAHLHVEYPPPPRARVALHRAATRAAARSVSRFGRRRADEMRDASPDASPDACSVVLADFHDDSALHRQSLVLELPNILRLATRTHPALVVFHGRNCSAVKPEKFLSARWVQRSEQCWLERVLGHAATGTLSELECGPLDSLGEHRVAGVNGTRYAAVRAADGANWVWCTAVIAARRSLCDAAPPLAVSTPEKPTYVRLQYDDHNTHNLKQRLGARATSPRSPLATAASASCSRTMCTRAGWAPSSRPTAASRSGRRRARDAEPRQVRAAEGQRDPSGARHHAQPRPRRRYRRTVPRDWRPAPQGGQGCVARAWWGCALLRRDAALGRFAVLVKGSLDKRTRFNATADWRDARLLFGGNHPGCIERRDPTLITRGIGSYCEFDGRLAAVRFGGRLLVYTRANLASHGQRFVQFTATTDATNLDDASLQMRWDPFRLIAIDGYRPSHGEIYFFAVQQNPVHNGSLVAIFPLIHHFRACVMLALSAASAGARCGGSSLARRTASAPSTSRRRDSCGGAPKSSSSFTRASPASASTS